MRQRNSQKLSKWGAYFSESADFGFAREEYTPSDFQKGVEAEIMDWADDVTYSIHDVEDFYKAGLVPLDKLARDSEERGRFYTARFSNSMFQGYSSKELVSAFEDLVPLMLLKEPYGGSDQQRCNLRQFTSFLIARYLNAIKLAMPPLRSSSTVEIDPQLKKEILVWKQLTWHYVIERASLATQQHGQRELIKRLFNIYLEAALSGNKNLFSISFRKRIEDASRTLPVPLPLDSDIPSPRNDADVVRIVIDLIAGLTEQQAVTIYQRLSGISLGSFLESVS